MTPAFDTADYYAFVLEAFSRFGQEGWHRNGPWRLFARRKPSLFAAVARRMAALGIEPGDVLEFGTYRGRSIGKLARLFPRSRLFGFDTFSGFPEDGRRDWRANDFATAIPKVPRNVELIVGRFQDTLPSFRQRTDITRPASLIHVDCDLYSSTACVLRELGPDFIRPGTILLFDELMNYDEFLENELLALYQFLEGANLSFAWFVTVGGVYPLETMAKGDTPGAWTAYRAAGCYQNAAVQITAPGDGGARGRHLDAARRLAALRPLRQPLLRG